MFNKIKNCLKNNKIFYLNIFLSALLICFICLCVNKYSVLYNHGYIYPWFDLGWRIASQTYESVINNFLPVLFNSNPNDFRSGLGPGSVILASLYVFMCFLFVKGFFLSDPKARNPLLRKELCLILPLAALLLYIPLYDCNDKYAIIFRFNDLATSAEYFFVLIPVLIAAFAFHDILMGGKKENKRVLIFYALISYVAGYYNELANITLFSFGFFFLFFLFLFDRQKLFNKYSLFIIVPFLTGCINYYIFSGSALSNIAHYDSTLLDGVRNLQTNFVDIWHSFVYEIFVSKAAFYAGIISLSLILYKLKTENYKNVLFFVWSLIFGYVLANLSTIFVCSLGSETEYLFERTFWDRLYVNILELACLILLGAIYKYEKIKEYVFAFIAVFFVEENINTLEMSSEFVLTILSSVAQQESETISSHVKLGLKMKQQRGELIGYNGCLGYTYDKENKSISINQEEAEIVKYIFNRYAQGVGSSIIARELTNMKYLTPKGLTRWSDSTVRRILKNEKYKGDVLQGKTYTTDPITHKRVINMGEENQYYIKEHHIAIIEPELFDKVQQILEKRAGSRSKGKRRGNYSRKYPFSSRIYCGFCGTVLTRRNWNSKTKNETPVWHCMNFVKRGKQECPKCKAMRETVIENCFVDAYKILCSNKGDIVNKFITRINNIITENSSSKLIENIETEKEKLKSKMNKLIDLSLENAIDISNIEIINYVAVDNKLIKIPLEVISLSKNLSKLSDKIKETK